MTPSIDTMTRKSVLITGCSAGGIGSALVEAFQKRNLHVFATARDLSKMTHLDGLPNMTLLPLDPTSVLNVQTAFETVQAHIGGTLDYLVNNADQMIVTPTLNFDIKIVKKLYDINVWGMVRVTVNTPWMGLYAGSKAAMTPITEALRLELTPLGVTVVTVNIGAVRTNTLANDADFKLPTASKYKSIEKEIAGRARGEDGTPRMDPRRLDFPTKDWVGCHEGTV
ncbi:MAG: hypothetical protein ASARMPREDX12_008495 [Alectoria sarmentosa]|nr:MAG: hypothetical protein ASARMPREDX12_008495 [Alectoria sarmentosa]